MAGRTGITFHEKVDDLFINATLPEGWHIRPTEHRCWSELTDEQGAVQAEIFYKAASYDRRADITWRSP